MGILKELYASRREYGSNLFRMGLTFIDNSLAYALNRQPKRGPMRIGWSITYKCCAKCVYCTSWKKAANPKRKELTTEEALSIIRQIGELKSCVLSFTGGEPLIRNDIMILIKEAKKQGIRVNLNSNGFFLKEKAKELVDSGVDVITIGMDSYKASVHDKIKRVPGIFKKACEGIEEIRRLRKGKKLLINIRGVITNKNYRELDKYIDFWKDKVDNISLQPIHTGVKSSVHNIKEENVKNIKINDLRDFSESFKNLQKKYKFLSNLYYDEVPTFFSNPNSLSKKYRCFAGYYFFKIDPYGNCYPCAQMIDNVGNLRENSLKEIWLGDKLNKWRKIIREKKNKCGACWHQYFMLNTQISRLLGPFLKKEI